MPDQDLININEDLATILSKKRKYHEEQIAFHQGELQKLSAYNSSSNGSSGTLFDAVAKAKSFYDKPWWWVKNIPSFVKVNFLNTEFKNSDMIRVAHIPGIENDDYRKEVRYALSVALRECVVNGMLTKRKEAGIKGFFYKKK